MNPAGPVSRNGRLGLRAVPPQFAPEGRRLSRALRRLPALPAIALVRAYQLLLGPLLGGSCKYHPSCSEYALDALRGYGLLRGSVLTAWRLLRCNPWSHGGVDHAHEQTVFARRPAGTRHA